METKICTKCGKEKPEIEFRIKKGKRISRCKRCEREYFKCFRESKEGHGKRTDYKKSEIGKTKQITYNKTYAKTQKGRETRNYWQRNYNTKLEVKIKRKISNRKRCENPKVKEAAKNRQKKYYLINPEIGKIKCAKAKIESEKLTDVYVEQVLAINLKVKILEIRKYPHLIETKKALLKLTRLIKIKKQNGSEQESA